MGPAPAVNPAALTVSAVILVAALVSAVAQPRRIPPAAVTVPGAAVLTLVGVIAWPDAVSAVRAIAPTVGFLVLVVLLGHLSEREGVVAWAAAVTAHVAGRSPSRLLAGVVVLAAVVTAVLSLDATVVLLAPVVLATATRLQTPHRPYTYAAGHLANSASLLLPVSNLTNLLAFAATGLSFLHFSGLMLAPWLAAVSVEYLLLRRIFRVDLAERVAATADVPSPPLPALILVGLTITGFALASPLGLSPLWPAALGVTVLTVRQLLARTTRVGDLVTAANPSFALFILGLAVIVLAVRRSGVDHLVATVLPTGHGLADLLVVAGIAAVAANLVNNLPATLTLLPLAAASGPATALAVLIGVNIGPNLTYSGSLANLLWRRALHGAAPGALSFSRLGVATVPLTLVAATTALWAVLQL